MTVHDMRRRTAAGFGLAAGLAVALAASIALATPAWAHNVLLQTSPVAGSTVGRVPTSVLLTFDKPALALGTALEVEGPAGNVAVGSPVLVDTTVRQTLRAGSSAGTYTVRWRVTSADGHPVSGSFTFTARAAGGDPTASAAPAQGSAGSPAAAAGTSVLWWFATAAGLVVLGVMALLATRRSRGGRPGTRDVQEGALDG